MKVTKTNYFFNEISHKLRPLAEQKKIQIKFSRYKKLILISLSTDVEGGIAIICLIVAAVSFCFIAGIRKVSPTHSYKIHSTP
jgi:hypothetical protein